MRYSDNKGRREEEVPLHPVVIEHLQSIPGFDRMVFPWPHHERTLWSDFARIQQAVGVRLPC